MTLRRITGRLVFENCRNRPLRASEALTIEVPFKIKSKTFNKIFGGDRVRLRISGNITINGGFRREGTSQIQTVTGQNTAQYNFHIDQTQRFKITGEVGDKVSVDVDQNSESTFDFENSLKLTYTGHEDEIIQKIEAGNVSLQLAGTQLAAFSGQNKGLFGLKTELKIGALSLTTIASLEKGQKNKLTVSGGAQQNTYDLNVNMPLVGRYFFIDKLFRERFKSFDGNMVHTKSNDHFIQTPNVDFYLYKLNTGPQLPADYIHAYAIYRQEAETYPYDTNPQLYALPIDTVIAMTGDGRIPQRDYETGLFVRLNQGTDYTIDGDLGYIRLNSLVTGTDVLAVAYRTQNGNTIGEMAVPLRQDSTYILKLIRHSSPLPGDHTYKLAWRNVYGLSSGGSSSSGIEKEGFSFQIVYQSSGAAESQSFTDSTSGTTQTFLTAMGLDTKNSANQNQPDGIIDDFGSLINYSTGEVFFPDLQPFDPEGYLINGQPPAHTLPSFYNIPGIYNSTVLPSTYFKFKVQSKSVNSTYNLGFNVLEGSEEVTLGGAKLTKGTDYVIDYYSGTLTILNQAALAPSANLQILYESGEMFQLDKKTLLGVRGEYALWDQSFLGATLLYLNERPMQDRVKIGNEPLRNFLWDLNTHLVFKPEFLTMAVDRLPLISTEAPSAITLEGEYAQVHPNPNPLNNAATGDPDGVAYVDDFESIKKTTPLGIMRRQWTMASYPAGSPVGKGRGQMAWFNPFDQVPIKDIWENRPTNSNVAQKYPRAPLLVSTHPFDRTDQGFAIFRILGRGHAFAFHRVRRPDQIEVHRNHASSGHEWRAYGCRQWQAAILI